MRLNRAVTGLAALAVVLTSTVSGAAPPTCDGQPATIIGTAGDNVIEGTDGDDVIVAFAGRDDIRSLGGNDTICAGADADFIDAGPGDDFVHAGTSGNEPSQYDQVLGGEGDDELRDPDGGGAEGGPGDDVIVGFGSVGGGAGNDTIRATNNRPFGVYYVGGSGDDILVGSDRRDILVGGPGDDVSRGKGNNDYLYPGTGSDTIDGGSGSGDTVSYSDLFFPVVVNLAQGIAVGLDVSGKGGEDQDPVEGRLEVYGIGVGVADAISNVEDAEGTIFADHLIGDDGDNDLDGCGGSDWIEGLGGDDDLYGISGLLGPDGSLHPFPYFEGCEEGVRPPLDDISGKVTGLAQEQTAWGEMILDGGNGHDWCWAPNIRINCESGA